MAGGVGAEEDADGHGDSKGEEDGLEGEEELPVIAHPLDDDRGDIGDFAFEFPPHLCPPRRSGDRGAVELNRDLISIAKFFLQKRIYGFHKWHDTKTWQCATQSIPIAVHKDNLSNVLVWLDRNKS